MVLLLSFILFTFFRMKEKAEREAFLLSGEKAFEKQDLAEMEKEIKQVEENIQREVKNIIKRKKIEKK